MQYWWTAETSLSFLNRHFRVQILWVSDLSPSQLHSDFPSGIICVWQRGSLTVEDHFRSILGIICGTVLGSFAIVDHLRYCTNVNLTPRKLAKLWQIERRQINAIKSERTTLWHHFRGHLKSLTKVAGSSFESFFLKCK